jgi:hypothetical protein
MPNDPASFPPWLIYTSLALTLAAIGLVLFAWWQPRRVVVNQPPPTMPPPADAPPPPPLAVAPKPLAPFNRATERRAGFRRVGNPVEVLVCDAEFKAAPLRGWVVDRSRLGVRLSVAEKYPNGTILQVRPAASPDAVPWQAVEVRNAQPNETTWELGCQFTSEPSWEVLLLFG